jgi:peptidoglycan-associated lipoprotein
MRNDLMRIHCRKALLIGTAICFIAASSLSAQAARNAAGSSTMHGIDVAVTYSTARSNAVGGNSFWMQGGGVQIHGHVYRGLGVVGELYGLHKGDIQSSGVGLDLLTATVGPRYTWRLSHTRCAFFGQALMGIAGGFHSDFPLYYGIVPTAKSFAFKTGGGVNIGITQRVALRAIEADWLRTQFPNSTNGSQSNLQLTTGFVFRF